MVALKSLLEAEALASVNVATATSLNAAPSVGEIVVPVLAKAALNSTPRSEQAISFLLQAAARSSWQGDPETLIPADLVGSVHADMGLAEFLRKRDVPDWAQKTRELARNHIDLPEFRRVDAIAVLQLALGSDVFVGKAGAVSREDLDRAATDTLAMAESCLTNAFADVQNYGHLEASSGANGGGPDSRL